MKSSSDDVAANMLHMIAKNSAPDLCNIIHTHEHTYTVICFHMKYFSITKIYKIGCSIRISCKIVTKQFSSFAKKQQNSISMNTCIVWQIVMYCVTWSTVKLQDSSTHTRDVTIHNLDVSIYCHLCITIQQYIARYNKLSVNLLVFSNYKQEIVAELNNSQPQCTTTALIVRM